MTNCSIKKNYEFLQNWFNVYPGVYCINNWYNTHRDTHWIIHKLFMIWVRHIGNLGLGHSKSQTTQHLAFSVKGRLVSNSEKKIFGTNIIDCSGGRLNCIWTVICDDLAASLNFDINAIRIEFCVPADGCYIISKKKFFYVQVLVFFVLF